MSVLQRRIQKSGKTSMMECLATKVNGQMPFTVFAYFSTLNVLTELTLILRNNQIHQLTWKFQTLKVKLGA